MTRPYLLGLKLAGRRVVVVGGGAVAQRRVGGLREAGAAVAVVSPSLTPALSDLAAAGRLEWVPRRYADGDLAGAWLVHACTDDPAANAAVAAAAEAAGVWCVRADDRTASAAWTPASAHVEPITLGVHAGGNPRRAAAVRDALVRTLLDSGLVREATRDTAGDATGTAGRVALVGGGPGDPDLITVRGRRLLAQADVVIADRLAPKALLDELPPDVEVVDAAKNPRGRAMAQEEINRLLVEHAKAGRAVVRLKGGDPFVFGRGMEEVLACAAAGIEVTVVPGVSSVTGVPTAAGIPVTHRGVTQEFTVVSGHLPPGHPGSTVDWSRLAGAGTLVLLMAVDHRAAIAAALTAAGRDPATPVACVENGTTPDMRLVRTTLANLATAEVRSPAILLVGEVAALQPD
jgi:uroporphyrin-III C-methyltransferase / precorrin-2 dehydrogenase / sirohydrochlorin ferrochelatase